MPAPARFRLRRVRVVGAQCEAGQFAGETRVCFGSEVFKPFCDFFGKIQFPDKIADLFLRYAVPAREFFQFFVGVFQIVSASDRGHAHYLLYRLRKHFPGLCQIPAGFFAADGNPFQALRQIPQGKKGISQSDSDVAQCGRIREIALHAGGDERDGKRVEQCV